MTRFVGIRTSLETHDDGTEDPLERVTELHAYVNASSTSTATTRTAEMRPARRGAGDGSRRIAHELAPTAAAPRTAFPTPTNNSYRSHVGRHATRAQSPFAASDQPAKTSSPGSGDASPRATSCRPRAHHT